MINNKFGVRLSVLSLILGLTMTARIEPHVVIATTVASISGVSEQPVIAIPETEGTFNARMTENTKEFEIVDPNGAVKRVAFSSASLAFTMMVDTVPGQVIEDLSDDILTHMHTPLGREIWIMYHINCHMNKDSSTSEKWHKIEVMYRLSFCKFAGPNNGALNCKFALASGQTQNLCQEWHKNGYLETAIKGVDTVVDKIGNKKQIYVEISFGTKGRLI